MTRDQIKYCGAIMRNLKKHRDAAPFLHPVDYIKLNVPDYPKVIKYPMDLTTVDKKLNTGEYDSVEEFINDIRLVFNNCYKFNGPEAMISMLCQNVESAFEKSLRQMPPSREVIALLMSKYI
jgi:bromodomain-containing factor 1